MYQKIKYISHIKDDFDVVISGVNGVFAYGENVDNEAIDALIKLYQSGKKVVLASNSGMRVSDLYYLWKRKNVPMNIFYAMITAGEIAHWYLRNNLNLGHSYYNLSSKPSKTMAGLDYEVTESPVMADFILIESDSEGIDSEKALPILEQALHLQLPIVCVGNNTSLMSADGVVVGAGALAEKYAMMGGQILPFGKPDTKIAAYLTEGISGFEPSRCLVIGDCMATDMRMGSHFGAQTLFLTGGVHQISGDIEQRLNDLSESYGLNVDYYMEKLQW